MDMGVVMALPTLRSFPGLDSEGLERRPDSRQGHVAGLEGKHAEGWQSHCRMDLPAGRIDRCLIPKALPIAGNLSHGQMSMRHMNQGNYT